MRQLKLLILPAICSFLLSGCNDAKAESPCIPSASTMTIAPLDSVTKEPIVDATITAYATFFNHRTNEEISTEVEFAYQEATKTYVWKDEDLVLNNDTNAFIYVTEPYYHSNVTAINLQLSGCGDYEQVLYLCPIGSNCRAAQ